MKIRYFLIWVLLLTIIVLNSLISQDKFDPPKLPLNMLNLESDFVMRDFNKFIIGWNYINEGRQRFSSFPVINKDYQEGGGIMDCNY